MHSAYSVCHKSLYQVQSSMRQEIEAANKDDCLIIWGEQVLT